MKNKKTLNSILLSFSTLAILAGCTMHNDPILEEQAKCGTLKPILSLEQNLKKFSSEDGFTARIQNYTQFNPSIYANSFLDIREELKDTNLDFEIYNYSDVMDVKRISIFAKGNRYIIDKELLKVEFIAENNRFYSIEQISKIFASNNIFLNIPSHLMNKPVILTPGAAYKLSDLLNEISNKLIEMSIFHTVTTRFNNQTKKNEIIIKLEELRYKLPIDILNKIQAELRNNNIPSKIDNAELVVLGNYKQQLIAKDLLERKTKNFANVYVVCFKNGDNFNAITVNDGIETPLDTYDSITVSKIGIDNNGIEDYSVFHKTKGNQKEYKIKTNERKININKENLNAKIYLY